jgi:hypothetical protein
MFAVEIVAAVLIHETDWAIISLVLMAIQEPGLQHLAFGALQSMDQESLM